MTIQKKSIAILISGRGSNMKSLIEATESPNFPARIAVVLSNDPTASGLEFAQKKGIPTRVINHKDYNKDRLKFDMDVSTALAEFTPDWVCLAGYMRLVTPWFCQKWHNKLINIHPSLLPDFKGINAPEQAFNAGAKTAGCTVHLVRPEMDSGPVLGQASISIEGLTNPADVASQILQQEHRLYPEILRKLCASEITIQGDAVTHHS